MIDDDIKRLNDCTMILAPGICEECGEYADKLYFAARHKTFKDESKGLSLMHACEKCKEKIIEENEKHA